MLHCAEGGEPITGYYYTHEGRPYCDRHYFQRFGERCSIGGEILRGRVWRNCWGETYCQEHAAGLPKCGCCHRHVCSRLTGGGVRYGDGRVVCHRCRATAIDHEAQGRPVMREVCRVLKNVGGLDLGDGAWIGLELGDRDDLACDPPLTIRNAWGLAHYREQEIKGRPAAWFTVQILHGLSRAQFAAICAHELGHIYMYRHDFPALTAKVSEGLCEIAKFTWLMEQRTKDSEVQLRSLARNRDPIYGAGFHAAYRALYGRRLIDVFDHVRRTGHLPP